MNCSLRNVEKCKGPEMLSAFLKCPFNHRRALLLLLYVWCLLKWKDGLWHDVAYYSYCKGVEVYGTWSRCCLLLTDIQIFNLQCVTITLYLVNRHFLQVLKCVPQFLLKHTMAASYMVIVIENHCVLSFYIRQLTELYSKRWIVL